MATEPTTKSPTALVEKPTPPEFDAFHPEMPSIPGVSEGISKSPHSPHGTGTPSFARVGGIIAVALVMGVAITWWIKSAPGKAVESGTADTTSGPASVKPFSVQDIQVPEGLAVAASVEELSKPWSAKKFIFVNPVTGKKVNAMVIRLPSGGFWAFSLQEPYGQCELEFVTDLGRLSSKFGYQAHHPMVAIPCNNTIYDPTKVATLGGDVWARGEIVQGEGVRPPISIDVQVKDHSVIADSIE